MSALVMGIDLSLTGSGISNGHTTSMVTSKGKAADSLGERFARLTVIRFEVCQAITAHGIPQLVVIEQPAFSKQAGHAHDRSGLWWSIVTWLIQQHIPVAEVAPTGVKKYATGKGNANKDAMVDATARRFPDVDTGGGNNNRCDAQWLAAMGHDYLEQPIIVMPAVNRQSLAAVRWPRLTAVAS